jgi:hypothetical protein
MKQPRLLDLPTDGDGDRTKTTHRLDRRAQSILDSFRAEHLLSENAALNFLIKEFQRMRDEVDTHKKK